MGKEKVIYKGQDESRDERGSAGGEPLGTRRRYIELKPARVTWGDPETRADLGSNAKYPRIPPSLVW